MAIPATVSSMSCSNSSRALEDHEDRDDIESSVGDNAGMLPRIDIMLFVLWNLGRTVYVSDFGLV
jgi:hypothetical protein